MSLERARPTSGRTPRGSASECACTTLAPPGACMPLSRVPRAWLGRRWKGKWRKYHTTARDPTASGISKRELSSSRTRAHASISHSDDAQYEHVVAGLAGRAAAQHGAACDRVARACFCRARRRRLPADSVHQVSGAVAAAATRVSLTAMDASAELPDGQRPHSIGMCPMFQRAVGCW
jgi:hypothetical protein